MNGFTLDERLVAVRARYVFEELRTLDHVWTEYLDKTKTIPDHDVQNLKLVAERLCELLTRSAQEAESLLPIVTKHASWLDERFAYGLARAPLTAEHKKKVTTLLERGKGLPILLEEGFKVESKTGFSNIVVQALQVCTKATRAIPEIERKKEMILSGRFTQGDLPRWAVCGGIGAAAGAAAGTSEVAFAIYLIVVAASEAGCY